MVGSPRVAVAKRADAMPVAMELLHAARSLITAFGSCTLLHVPCFGLGMSIMHGATMSAAGLGPQIINVNLDLVGVGAKAQQAPAEAQEGANARQERLLELGSSLRLWLELQGAVNGLFDSTAVDKKSLTTPPVSCWPPAVLPLIAPLHSAFHSRTWLTDTMMRMSNKGHHQCHRGEEICHELLTAE